MRPFAGDATFPKSICNALINGPCFAVVVAVVATLAMIIVAATIGGGGALIPSSHHNNCCGLGDCNRFGGGGVPKRDQLVLPPEEPIGPCFPARKNANKRRGTNWS